MTFVDRGSVIGVFRAPLRRYDKAAKTIASLQVSDYNLSSPDAGVSPASSSSCNRSISALVVTSSAWGFETVTVSLSKVLEGPAADLLATVFRGIVTGVLNNSR